MAALNFGAWGHGDTSALADYNPDWTLKRETPWDMDNPFRKGTQAYNSWESTAKAAKGGNPFAKQSLQGMLPGLMNNYSESDKMASIARRMQSLPAAQTSPANSAPKMSSQVMPSAAYGGLRNVNADTQYDAQGRPIRNNYTSITDPSGNLLKQFSIADKIGSDVALNDEGLRAMRSRALATGPSTWANLATQSQQLDEANARNAARRTGAAGLNNSLATLAGKGGVSAGMRERLALANNRNTFQNVQNVTNQGMGQRLQIGLQDQQMKDQFLNQLPGQELNYSNFMQNQRDYRNRAQATDISNSLKDIGGYNAYNSGAYADAMKAWGAEKSADAQAQAAKAGSGGGGFLSNVFGSLF